MYLNTFMHTIVYIIFFKENCLPHSQSNKHSLYTYSYTSNQLTHAHKYTCQKHLTSTLRHSYESIVSSLTQAIMEVKDAINDSNLYHPTSTVSTLVSHSSHSTSPFSPPTLTSPLSTTTPSKSISTPLPSSNPNPSQTTTTISPPISKLLRVLITAESFYTQK